MLCRKGIQPLLTLHPTTPGVGGKTAHRTTPQQIPPLAQPPLLRTLACGRSGISALSHHVYYSRTPSAPGFRREGTSAKTPGRQGRRREVRLNRFLISLFSSYL